MDDSVLTCDEFNELCNKETKTVPMNFNENKATCIMQSFYISIAFLLIIIALLTAVSIYSC